MPEPNTPTILTLTVSPFPPERHGANRKWHPARCSAFSFQGSPRLHRRTTVIPILSPLIVSAEMAWLLTPPTTPKRSHTLNAQNTEINVLLHVMGTPIARVLAETIILAEPRVLPESTPQAPLLPARLPQLYRPVRAVELQVLFSPGLEEVRVL